MGVKREYTVAQALAMINRSEGCIVRDNQVRLATHDEPGAHALGRHLVYAGRGPKAGYAFVRDRFTSSPAMTSSAWFQKGDMAIRLCEALNSPIGQAALEMMDSQRVSRVVIHYANRNVMTNGGDLFNPKHMSVDYTVTPDRVEMESIDIHNKKTGEFIKTIQKKKTIKGGTSPNVHSRQVVGIHCVLDQFGAGMSTAGLHLQTLFPSYEPIENSFEYSVGLVTWTVTQVGSDVKRSFSTR